MLIHKTINKEGNGLSKNYEEHLLRPPAYISCFFALDIDLRFYIKHSLSSNVRRKGKTIIYKQRIFVHQSSNELFFSPKCAHSTQMHWRKRLYSIELNNKSNFPAGHLLCTMKPDGGIYHYCAKPNGMCAFKINDRSTLTFSPSKIFIKFHYSAVSVALN